MHPAEHMIFFVNAKAKSIVSFRSADTQVPRTSPWLELVSLLPDHMDVTSAKVSISKSVRQLA
jgi:hypothetical protein